MIKILLGGSPCTYWSIAQTQGRETEPSGLGWELFKNYLVAKKKFAPDLFLYENNKSAAQAIKAQIKKELNVWDGTMLMADSGARYIEINSALVSAQNRQRFYVHNCGEVAQPKDRGVLLKDVLEGGWLGTQADLYAVPTGTRQMDKARCLRAGYKNAGQRDFLCDISTNGQLGATGVVEAAEPVIFRNPHGFNKGGIKTDKAPTMTSNGSWQDNNKILEPVNDTVDGKAHTIKAQYYKNGVANFVTNRGFDATAVAMPTSSKTPQTAKIYKVKNELIEIKGKQYPVKLSDGCYTIRKLTVKECCRLQTMPDEYCKAVSKSQGYKGLGNGWTAEVIIHILHNALKDVPKDERIVVLSMYDGIGTGRYCLDKMGFANVEYHAYEIDKYAMQIAMSNYPDIIQHGDAFDVNKSDWKI